MSQNLPSVQILKTQCKKCGSRTTASYHDSSNCQGLVIEIDDTLQCSGCGVTITPNTICPHCDYQATTTTISSVVSLRQSIPSMNITDALCRKIQNRYSKQIKNDRILAAIANHYVNAYVEKSFFGSRDQSITLADHIETLELPIGGYQTYTLEYYPDGETVDAICNEIYSDYLSEFPGDKAEFTHLGMGVKWNPKGGLQIAIIAAKRLISLPTDMDPKKLEQAIHAATNEQRTSHRYTSLNFDTHLSSIARSHSRSMAIQGFFAHESPDGITTMNRYQRADYDNPRAGENIAKRYPATTANISPLAADIVNNWMGSPGHRENILTSSFTVEGIGVYQSNDGAVFITQNFG